MTKENDDIISLNFSSKEEIHGYIRFKIPILNKGKKIFTSEKARQVCISSIADALFDRKCNCLIAFYRSDRFRKSNVQDKVRNLLNRQKMLIEHGFSSHEPLTIRDIFEAKNKMISMLNYCPFCGEKINWKEIIQAIENEQI